jgi:hypothetical protein
MNVQFDPASIAAEAVAAASTPPDIKRPLHRELPPSAPYPVDALGALKPAAEAIHLITQAPMAICCQSVLATATLAVQALYDVQGPVGRKPLTGLFVSIAESGERKSACDSLALKPVLEIERKWQAAYKEQVQTYLNSKKVWETARTEATNKTKAKGSTAMLQALDELGFEPKPPPSPMLLVENATEEGITMHLAQNRPWGGQFTAEGGLVVGGHSMKPENRMRMGALYNTLWDGTPIRRTRAMAGNVYLPGCRFTMHLMMQPNVSGDLLNDETLSGLGTTARFLIVAPESTAGTRMYREPPALAWACLGEYETAIKAFLDRAPTATGDEEPPEPFALRLTTDAKALWMQFHDEVEKRLTQNGPLAPIRAWGSKMPEHAMRLAAILAAYQNPQLVEVSGEAMARGIILAQHYASEMLRLSGAAAVSPDLKMAQRLLAWWQSRPSPRLHLAEAYQRGLNSVRDAATARRLITILEEHGWVTRLPPGIEMDGKPRKEAWELIP